MADDESHAVHRLMVGYVALWNERDPLVRRAAGTEVFTPEAVYVDPQGLAKGRSAIDGYVAAWQQQFVDLVFVLGEVSSHHDVAHFTWSFGPPGQPPVAKGRDVVVLWRGQISRVCGFFE